MFDIFIPQIFWKDPRILQQFVSPIYPLTYDRVWLSHIRWPHSAKVSKTGEFRVGKMQVLFIAVCESNFVKLWENARGVLSTVHNGVFSLFISCFIPKVLAIKSRSRWSCRKTPNWTVLWPPNFGCQFANLAHSPTRDKSLVEFH